MGHVQFAKSISLMKTKWGPIWTELFWNIFPFDEVHINNYGIESDAILDLVSEMKTSTDNLGDTTSTQIPNLSIIFICTLRCKFDIS